MHGVSGSSQAVPLETYNGLITLARPENVPEGASPRNYDVDYDVGSVRTRDPLQNVYLYESAVAGPNAGAAAVNVTVGGNAWSNPTNILHNDGKYASCTPSTSGDALDLTELAFNLASTVSPTGVTVSVPVVTTSSVTLNAQLLLNGAPVGNAKSVPAASGKVTFGGAGDDWGAGLTSVQINSTSFGVRLTATSAFSAAQIFLGYTTVAVGLTTSNANFNFITSFVAQNGAVKNLSLDANGEFWVEDVTNLPGTLTLAFDGVRPGSFATAVNGPDVAYLAFNDLSAGCDIPRQYSADWVDRISQVGPGASPVFSATGTAAGVPAPITAFSVSSNQVTLTAANSFSAGTAVLFSDLTVATFLNGQTLLVESSGLSTTQFKVAFTTADVATTSDTGTATPQSNYPIASITQPAAHSNGFSYFLRSTGPGSTSPGSTITFYYQDSTTGGVDTDLQTAFNAGAPVYAYVSFIGPVTYGPHVVRITSLGIGSPPNQPRQFYYFTFADPENVAAYTLFAGSGHPGYVANYQRTEATVITTTPVPQLQVGSQATIAQTSVPQYNNTWRVTRTPNASAMVITQTSLTAGVATYSYSVSSGSNPAAGQLVTITNTLNANGMLNGVDLPIDTVTGTTTGTFTVSGFSSAQDYPAAAEQGQATTAGTQFTIDPGAGLVTSDANPIYGTATGGFIIFAGNGQYIGAGTKQGAVSFITRNGYWTAPSLPATFSVPENTTAIRASQIPIGPPNVVARVVHFTESGAENVPGANFYTLPTPVQYYANGLSYYATSLIIWDNTTTEATFSFQDSELLNGEAIDVQGNNLFNLIELGNPGWVVKYASRNFYGLCQNKVQNFTNLSFDGGYLPGAQLTPLGWSAPDQYGQLLNSPTFGNSYYIKNTTEGVLGRLGMISQAAFQDGYEQPILATNTAYSVRVTARAPSGKATGNLVLDLTVGGVSYGSFTLALADLSSSMATKIGTLLETKLATIPTDLQLNVYGAGFEAGADVEIDRIEIFPTAIPVLTTSVFASYAGDLESVDAVTGLVKCEDENQQPVNGAVVMDDILYLLKQQSKYSLQSSGGLEPSQWSEPEVAQHVGSCGVNAYDFGEQWMVEACRPGLYVFNGGQPGKIMQEIHQVWDAINWSAGRSIWVRNDVPNRKLYVGVPLPTPNFWLPNAKENLNPTTPNVILMCNYQGCDSADALKLESGLHVTMFGSLNSTDMKRKWSIWQIPSPYAAVVSAGGSTDGNRNLLDAEMRFGNGIGSGKVYRLNTELGPDEIPTDDGAPIESLYTTYGHVNVQKAQQMPMLGLFRKLWGYMTHQISGAGKLGVRLLPNVLLGPNDSSAGYFPWTLKGGFTLTDPCTQIREAPLNFAATRTFVEFATTGRMNISNLVMVGKKHPHNMITGRR